MPPIPSTRWISYFPPIELPTMRMAWLTRSINGSPPSRSGGRRAAAPRVVGRAGARALAAELAHRAREPAGAAVPRVDGRVDARAAAAGEEPSARPTPRQRDFGAPDVLHDGV